MPKKRGPAPISGAQMAEQKDLFIELVSEGLSARKACASGSCLRFLLSANGCVMMASSVTSTALQWSYERKRLMMTSMMLLSR